jgi:CDP-glucose 4,6-dehydratase
MESLVINASFWHGRRVFLTGHTGFKGSWLSLWLHNLGANVTGFSLESPTNPCLFKDANVSSILERNILGNVCNASKLAKAMQDSSPEIVIHMAAQSLVQESYVAPYETFNTNVMGTVNLLEAVRKTPSVKVVLNVTSDKCYENIETDQAYKENNRMGGYDPYSSSKGCAELISSAYRKSFLNSEGIALATARAGNVIGGGDWASNRIIPDAIRAFTNNKKLEIRSPLSTRPWQHVLEPLSGYLRLCESMLNNPEKYSEGWNFGPGNDSVESVATLVDILVDCWGEGVGWFKSSDLHPHEAKILKLDSKKAKNELGWTSRWTLKIALNETALWYKQWQKGKDMNTFTINQIKKYETYP